MLYIFLSFALGFWGGYGLSYLIHMTPLIKKYKKQLKDELQN
jgi:hypothetical protein